MRDGLIGRYAVTGTLTAISALSVSEGKGGLEADITCQRDGRGRLIVPGTALAGCLRRAIADPRWGAQPGDQQAAVSRVYTFSAVLVDPTERLEVRDSVAINRTTGAAAEHMLHSREVVSPGARFSFGFELEVLRGEQTAEGAIEDGLDLASRIVRSLESGLVVGGATTRGLGGVQLDPGATITWMPLADRDAFLDALIRGPGAVEGAEVTADTQRRLTITVPWRQRSPLLVRVRVTGGVDAVPRVTHLQDGAHLTVPGASIKGVLRSHAERIVRTLLGEDAPLESLDQFREPLPLVSELFGRAPDARGSGALRGAASCADVCATEPQPDWAGILDKLKGRSDGERIDAATSLEASRWLRVDDHVAISRWTGGASDGKLFALVAPWPVAEPNWEPVRVTVDLDRLGARADAAVMLLALVIRDLCEGWLAFGHGTTRGYGEIDADPAEVTFHWSGPHRTEETGLSAATTALRSAWVDEVAAWRTDRPKGGAS